MHSYNYIISLWREVSMHAYNYIKLHTDAQRNDELSSLVLSKGLPFR